VILNVAGSSPVSHPTGQRAFPPSDFFLPVNPTPYRSNGFRVV
jgi:hypothetical protein